MNEYESKYPDAVNEWSETNSSLAIFPGVMNCLPGEIIVPQNFPIDEEPTKEVNVYLH